MGGTGVHARGLRKKKNIHVYMMYTQQTKHSCLVQELNISFTNIFFERAYIKFNYPQLSK